MLAIRMQRTGRSGHAQFRLIVQDSHFHPTRGRVVAYLGNYDPHAKTASVDKEAAQKYLDLGAQPSDRVAKILKDQGVKLPKWYKPSASKQRAIRNPEKLRRNRPAEEVVAEAAPAAEPAETAAPTEQPAEPEAETQEEQSGGEEVKPEESAPDAPAEPTVQEATAEAEAPSPETEQESTDQAA